MNYTNSAESSVSEDIDIDDYDNQFENTSRSSCNTKLNEHFNLSRRFLESRIGFQSTNNYFVNRTDQDEADGEEEDYDDNDENYVKTTYSSSREKYNNSYAIYEKSQENIFHKLNPKQFNLLKTFYDENKTGNQLLSVKFLNDLLLAIIEIRHKEIVASERDIKRILSLIDSDHDGYINLTELINLLSLLFAKPTNLTERIESVGCRLIINANHSNFYIDDWSNGPIKMSVNEADMFLDFLNEFYSPDTYGLLDFEEKSIAVADFSKQVSVFYETSLYII